MRDGIITFSSAVKSGRSWWNWKTNPSVLLRKRASRAPSSDARSVPPISTLPSSGESSAPSRCSSVVFPEPDGPTIAASAPGLDLEVDAGAAPSTSRAPSR